MAVLFANWPGYAKSAATVAPLNRPTVSRADLLSRMIWAARRGSANFKPADTETPGDTAAHALTAESRR
jgi:hypothetical protein